jgi:hypothetical protein
MADRRCALCGESIPPEKRADSIYCDASHRIEASRQRRLRQGAPVDGYPDLDAYLARQRRTKLGGGQ